MSGHTTIAIYIWVFFSSTFLRSQLTRIFKMTTVEGIQLLVRTIIRLSSSLPKNVPSATTSDKIYTVMHSDEGATTFETFNRRFDALFGEDCRSPDGRLHFIRQGKNGMALVCTYLKKLDWSSNIPLDLVEIKLSRLSVELTYLIESNTLSPPDPPASMLSTRPSRQKNPTFKLRDTNNVEQAELSFQRKAVQDFHMRQVPDASPSTTTEALPSQPLPHVTSATTPPLQSPVISQPKRSIETIEEDTDQDDSDDNRSVQPGKYSLSPQI
jgi:hypothetical protein